MQAVTELRKTGWYVATEDGSFYTDETGHIWFSKPVAFDIGRKLGMIPVSSSSGGLKQVVTGYAA